MSPINKKYYCYLRFGLTWWSIYKQTPPKFSQFNNLKPGPAGILIACYTFGRKNQQVDSSGLSMVVPLPTSLSFIGRQQPGL